MKVLFAGGHGYFPEINGGVESSTLHLVEQLRARGMRPRFWPAFSEMVSSASRPVPS